MMMTPAETAPDRSMPGLPMDPAEAWRAVAERNGEYSDRFRYAVVTTGIYCRPGCASRLPLRENVRFFSSAAAAEAAGFRACKRCRPERDRPSAARRSVERARRYLDAHLDETTSLETLAKAVDSSPFHLQRTFKHHTGLTPREYVQTRRMARLKGRLRAGDTVSRATFEAGFGSASRVYEQADAHLGMTPAAYREGGRGVQIRSTLQETPLGWLIVGATDRGVCAVALGDDPTKLENELRAEYPHAEIGAADEVLAGWVAAITDYLHGAGSVPDLPLDLQASAFRWRVWRALQAIPHGETRTYSDIAAAIGSPGAARAVAGACAGNPAALLIPCHRVLRRDAQPTRYRWGAERRGRLLDLERASE